MGSYFRKKGFHWPSPGFGLSRLEWSMLGEHLVLLLHVRKLPRAADWRLNLFLSTWFLNYLLCLVWNFIRESSGSLGLYYYSDLLWASGVHVYLYRATSLLSVLLLRQLPLRLSTLLSRDWLWLLWLGFLDWLWPLLWHDYYYYSGTTGITWLNWELDCSLVGAIKLSRDYCYD